LNYTSLLSLLILTVTAFRLALAWRQRRHVLAHRDQVPQRFADRIRLEAHQRAADYTVAKSRLTTLNLLVEAALALAFTVGGGIALLAGWADARVDNELLRGLALFALVAVIGGVIDLPFDLFRTFVLEQRFGFNRTTPAQWLKDHALGIGLGIAIGLPLATAVLWMMDALGARWWLWAWIAWMSFNVLMLAIYPTWIAPLFNRFTPLADADLRRRIEALMQQCGFHSSGLFVMDGSRRSAHGNAYFTGFGRTKRVVFFDTLLGSLKGIFHVFHGLVVHLYISHCSPPPARSVQSNGLLREEALSSCSDSEQCFQYGCDRGTWRDAGEGAARPFPRDTR